MLYGKRVAVIDDSPIDRRLFKDILGVDVFRPNQYQDVLGYDLILCDLVLDGYEDLLFDIIDFFEILYSKLYKYLHI